MTAKFPSVIEKMGYEATDKVVLFHIDDMGVSHAVNEAALECLDFGIATCGSAITGANWFPETAQQYRDHPNLDIGIHLSLTSEYDLYRWRPLSTVDNKSGLIDQEGYLWKTAQEAIENASPLAAELEMRAQVQLALDNYLKLTHVDSHMLSVLMPKFFDSYLNVASEFHLPALVPDISRNLLKLLGLESLHEFFTAKISELRAKNYPIVDHLVAASLDSNPNKVKIYQNMVRNTRPGLTHFLFHPAKKTPELTAMADESAVGRYQDYLSFTSQEVKDAVGENEIKIIGYREIQQYMEESSLF